MTCDSVAKLIPLYSYGELSPEEEDCVEEHMHQCAACAHAVERQRLISLALDRRQQEAPPELLAECRVDLMAAIRGGAPSRSNSSKGPWTLFLEAMGFTLSGLVRFRQPAGALALLAVGFFAARFTGVGGSGMPGALTTAGLSPSDQVFSTVRSVDSDSSGRVEIKFDETRRKVISGRLDDQNILKMMLTAASEDNPAVRLETVNLLKSRCNSAEVRDVLLNLLANDLNVGVRLKALEGLGPMAGDPQVQKTLTHVLTVDDNPAVKIQAIDLLAQHHNDAFVGVLQGLVQTENDSALRHKYEKMLKDVNASIGTF